MFNMPNMLQCIRSTVAVCVAAWVAVYVAVCVAVCVAVTLHMSSASNEKIAQGDNKKRE